MSTLKANSYQHVDRASPSIIINSDGSVSISSTVTYEDVTSVDAVGVITGRSNADLQNRVNVGSGVSIKAGGLNVTAGISTFKDDVEFHGVAGITSISFDKSDNSLKFIDNSVAKFGTGGDFSIFHDGTYNKIESAASIQLLIRGNGGVIIADAAGNKMIETVDGGPTDLYHDGTKRLATTTSGISVSDQLNVVGISTFGNDVYIPDKIIHSGDTNTQIRFPANDTISFETAGSERLRISAAGDLGLNVAPANWDTTFKALEGGGTSKHGALHFQANGDWTTSLGCNNYYNSGWKYRHAGGASWFEMKEDTFKFSLASSGSADGAITWSEKLRIQSNGRVGVGTESARAFLDLCGAAENATLLLDSNDENSNLCLMDNTGSVRMLNYGGALALRVGGTGAFSGDTEKVRIDSAGRVMLGTTTEGYGDADDLTIYNSGHAGMTIRSGTSSLGTLAFSDATSGSGEYDGYFQYKHNEQFFVWGTAASERMRLDNGGNLNIVGIVTATEFVPTAQPYGTKNIIVNGAMQVAQRGTSSTSQGYATIDRMPSSIGNTGQGFTQSRQSLSSSASGPFAAGFRNYKRYQIDAAGNTNTNAYAEPLYYKVEAQDLAASGWDCESTSSYITISFWFRVSTNQTFYLNLRSEDGTKRMFTIPFTAAGNNTWTKIVQKVPGASGVQIDNNNEQGMSMYFVAYYGTSYTADGTSTLTWNTHSASTQCPDMSAAWLTAGASTFDITGFQMEVGSEATPYQFLRYGEDIARCQRYFYRHAIGSAAANSVNDSITDNATMYNASAVFMTIPLPVQMRSIPTLGDANSSGYYIVYSNAGNGTASTFGLDGVTSQNVLTINGTIASSLTAGHAAMVRTNNAGAYIDAIAEL